jgi:hypothetical protein
MRIQIVEHNANSLGFGVRLNDVAIPPVSRLRANYLFDSMTGKCGAAACNIFIKNLPDRLISEPGPVVGVMPARVVY